MSLQKAGAFHADDAAPTSQRLFRKYFADEIISFHSCGVTTFAPTAARDQRQVVTSSSLRPPWLSVSPPAICDQMFGKQNKLFLVVWFVYMDRVSRLHEYSRMLWSLTKNYYPITSPNLRPAQLSTKVTPKCDHMFGKKNVFWLFGLLTWIVDRDYMNIPRC